MTTEFDQEVSSSSKSSPQKQDPRRADKIHPYRLKLWGNILLEDNTAESINFVSMILSMVAIVMKNKACGWISILVSAIAYGNARTSQEGQQLLSTFMLGSTALVLCYITNPAPIALSLIEADDRSPPTGAS